MIARAAVLPTVVLTYTAFAQPVQPVGVTLRVQGTCTITAGDVSEPATSGRLLYPRERLQCATGAMDVRLGCDERRINAAPDAVTVAWVGADCDRALIESVLADYGEPGGRVRGGSGILIAPTDQHTASSELVLRWSPQPGRLLTFEIRRAGAIATDVIWRLAGIDGALGRLERVDLQRALAGTRSARFEPLTLEVSGEGVRGQIAQFRLLSVSDERDLETALVAVAALSDAPLFRHVGRAALFKRYDLLPEAAAEYDAALAIAPESAALRARAIEAHAVTGDRERAAQLERDAR